MKKERYAAALRDKLVEETAEVCEADTSTVVGELADVYEVVRALVTCEGLNMRDLAMVAERKRVARGGFDKRIWLDDIVDG